MMVKKIILLVCVLTVVSCGQSEQEVAYIEAPNIIKHVNSLDNKVIIEAYKNKQSDVWVEGVGEVIKLLKDDTYGSRHQRFLVKLSMHERQTLLFAHNIDLAPRINSLKVGDTISFKGEYEYNPKGGVVHWTHHDPDGNQSGGWIAHQGKIYE